MKVHISAICGTAMGSLAGLLQARGDQVTGSDQDVYPPMSDQLAAMGIAIRSPYAEENSVSVGLALPAEPARELIHGRTGFGPR